MNGKRYEIKTHQVTCKRGKPMARTYLRSGRRPKGWSCRNYSAKVTKFRFICRRGARDFSPSGAERQGRKAVFQVFPPSSVATIVPSLSARSASRALPP